MKKTVVIFVLVLVVIFGSLGGVLIYRSLGAGAAAVSDESVTAVTDTEDERLDGEAGDEEGDPYADIIYQEYFVDPDEGTVRTAEDVYGIPTLPPDANLDSYDELPLPESVG
ncbi:MAG: hypothetical protein LBK41_07980 [Clostridiales bacterium]|jgi:hypothetical protein|nr:hypothetical protein [Clostridiales bacterium]